MKAVDLIGFRDLRMLRIGFRGLIAPAAIRRAGISTGRNHPAPMHGGGATRRPSSATLVRAGCRCKWPPGSSVRQRMRRVLQEMAVCADIAPSLEAPKLASCSFQTRPGGAAQAKARNALDAVGFAGRLSFGPHDKMLLVWSNRSCIVENLDEIDLHSAE